MLNVDHVYTRVSLAINGTFIQVSKNRIYFQIEIASDDPLDITLLALGRLIGAYMLTAGNDYDNRSQNTHDFQFKTAQNFAQFEEILLMVNKYCQYVDDVFVFYFIPSIHIWAPDVPLNLINTWFTKQAAVSDI